MVLGIFTGALGCYLGFLLATLWVGYRVNEDVANGALHGASVAFIAGIISMVSMIIAGTLFNMGPGMDLLSFGAFGVIIGLMIDGIIGTVGGIIGSYLKT